MIGLAALLAMAIALGGCDAAQLMSSSAEVPWEHWLGTGSKNASSAVRVTELDVVALNQAVTMAADGKYDEAVRAWPRSRTI